MLACRNIAITGPGVAASSPSTSSPSPKSRCTAPKERARPPRLNGPRALDEPLPVRTEPGADPPGEEPQQPPGLRGEKHPRERGEAHGHPGSPLGDAAGDVDGYGNDEDERSEGAQREQQ